MGVLIILKKPTTTLSISYQAIYLCFRVLNLSDHAAETPFWVLTMETRSKSWHSSVFSVHVRKTHTTFTTWIQCLTNDHNIEITRKILTIPSKTRSILHMFYEWLKILVQNFEGKWRRREFLSSRDRNGDFTFSLKNKNFWLSIFRGLGLEMQRCPCYFTTLSLPFEIAAFCQDKEGPLEFP